MFAQEVEGAQDTKTGSTNKGDVQTPHCCVAATIVWCQDHLSVLLLLLSAFCILHCHDYLQMCLRLCRLQTQRRYS